MVIGIDIGSTSTKVVGFRPDGAIIRLTTSAEDAVTSAAGALGKLLLENNITIGEISCIAATGAGAAKLPGNLFGAPVQKIDEFQAIGLGGMYLAGQDEIIITNVGTGTVIIEASRERIRHYGGSGVGGGTIVGLGKKLLMMGDVEDINALAAKGNLSRIDLLIGDIAGGDISFLRPEMSAANFGKVLDSASREDLALGILNMVYQVIGMLSVFAARDRKLGKVIVTGYGGNNPIGKKVLADITGMYGVEFEYPADGDYATAIGAALAPGAELRQNKI